MHRETVQDWGQAPCCHEHMEQVFFFRCVRKYDRFHQDKKAAVSRQPDHKSPLILVFIGASYPQLFFTLSPNFAYPAHGYPFISKLFPPRASSPPFILLIFALILLFDITTTFICPVLSTQVMLSQRWVTHTKMKGREKKNSLPR